MHGQKKQSVTIPNDYQQDTFIFAFPYYDMDKEIIIEVPELLIKVIVT